MKIQKHLKGSASLVVMIVMGILALGVFWTYTDYKIERLGTAIPTPVAVFETTLATEISSTATSFTLTSGETADGTTLSGFYGFVIDEGTSDEEFVTATCSDTACTGVTRGISVVTGNTTISALKHSHRKGASIKISDHPVLTVMARIMNGDESFPNPLSFDGLLSYVSPADNPAFSYDISNWGYTKGYIDDAVVSGAPVATLTVKGISEEATAAEINAGTQAGGTAAQLFVNPKYLADSIFKSYLPTSDQKDALAGEGTPASGNKYVCKDYSDTHDSDDVETSGNQSIGGIKTFISIPVLPASDPTTGNQATRKTYVDGGNFLVFVSAGEFEYTDANASLTQLDYFAVAAFPDAQSDVDVALNCKVPYGATSISSIKVIYKNVTPSTNLRILSRFSRGRAGAAIVSDETGTYDYATPANDNYIEAWTITAADYNGLGALVAGDTIGMRIMRDADHGDDTYADTWSVLGVLFTF